MKVMGKDFTARLVLWVLVLVSVVMFFGSASGVGSQAETGVRYKVVTGNQLLADREALEQQLNQYGDDGWELVYVVDRSALRAAVSGQFQDLLILKK